MRELCERGERTVFGLAARELGRVGALAAVLARFFGFGRSLWVAWEEG